MDVFVTASKTSQDSLVRRGFSRWRMRVIPDGVAAPGPRRPRDEVRRELALPASEPVFVMTAFFEPRKGHRVLVEALGRLGPNAPPIVLVGDGPERDKIVSLAKERGLEKVLRFAGFRADYLDIIAACDALVLPSLGSEDMPLVILDAMALGKPVVASRLAGIPEEVSHEETGLLVEPGDDGALAQALGRMADPQTRERFGKAGLERFRRNFEIGILTERYRLLYSGLLEDIVKSR